MTEIKKWYAAQNTDQSVIISSRVRLARNIKKYTFPLIMSPFDAKNVISEVVDAVLKKNTYPNDAIRYFNMNEMSEIDKLYNFEHHNISQIFIKNNLPKALILSQDESLSIMINEEDHIRIQTMALDDNISRTFELANSFDDMIEEHIEYAFDSDFGYLTSCPTNAGTGLRASFMVHLPMLEKTEQLKNFLQVISKFGMTVRGLHGEGTEPIGSIYQISNQITLGKSEIDIMKGLRNVVQQVIDQELKLRNELSSTQRFDMEDKIYRSYGILANCKKISSNEAIKLLSDIKLGYAMNFDIPKFKMNIYNIMMNIQPGSIQKFYGKLMHANERDIMRANYIKESLM